MRWFKLGVMMITHPIVVSEYIKSRREEKKNWLPVIVLILLMVGVCLFSIQYTHYPLSTVSTRKANLVLEVGKLVVPVLTWVLASYAMTTILDGESKFGETMTYSAYCLVPYILFTIPVTLLSRVMDQGQAGLYHALVTGILIWVVVLMITGLKEMNQYTPGKTVLVVALTLFTMVMIWATVIFLYTIVDQFVSMIREVYYEVIYRL